MNSEEKKVEEKKEEKKEGLPRVKLGGSDLTVSRLGLGCMGMNSFYTTGLKVKPEDVEKECLMVFEKAIEQGLNFFDTAECYGWGANETLVGKAIAANGRKNFIVCTKFGFVKPTFKLNSTPEHLKKVCDECMKRLGVDVIDVYYQHRLDTSTKIEETVKAMAELVKSGKVRALGLSEVGAEIISRAHKIHPIACVQTEYSLFCRDIETNGVLKTCRELGISIVAYSPVGRGILTGKIKSLDELADDDWRKNNPRFSKENIAHNLNIASSVEKFAKEKGCSAAQLALAWLLSQGKDIIPIPGTKRVKWLTENNASVAIELSKEDKKKLEDMCKGVKGDRYNKTKHEGWSY